MTRTMLPAGTTTDAPAGAVMRRLGTIVASHPVLDAYAGFVPPLLGVLQVRCSLTPWETASLLSIGPLTSGLCQPVFAWLSDRIDSRVFGAIGLAVAAACLSSIGLAGSFPTLVLLFSVGMLGVGAFHPVAAASMGQLSGDRRSTGVTIFFVAGMLGATAGPIISSRVTAIEPGGFDLLRWLMIPGLLAALLLHLAIRDVSHLHPEDRQPVFADGEGAQRWRAAMLLFLGNAMRYSVNIALFYVYVRWAESVVAQGHSSLGGARIAVLGAIYCGELNALTMLGMGVGGLVAGMLIAPGREKWPFVLIPLLLAPAPALFPFAGRFGGYGLALVTGIAYAAIIPGSISLAQRLLPHRTSLASSLTMGAAWAMATAAPPLAEVSIRAVGVERTFLVIACLLAASGLTGLALPASLLRQVSGRRARRTRR